MPPVLTPTSFPGGGGDISQTVTNGVTDRAPSEDAVFDAILLGKDKLGLTPTAVKTANYSAAAGDFIPCNTSGGAFTVTLPTAPADGTVIAIKLVTAGNTLNLALGGSDVFNKAGGSTSGTLTLLNQAILVQYKVTGAIWYVVADDLPASAFIRTLLDDADAATALATLGAIDRANGGLETIEAHGNTGATETINLANGNVHTAAQDQACVYTLSGFTNGKACSLTLILTSVTGAATWPAAVKWPDATAPTLSGVTIITFMSVDGGTTIYGFPGGKALA